MKHFLRTLLPLSVLITSACLPGNFDALHRGHPATPSVDACAGEHDGSPLDVSCSSVSDDDAAADACTACTSEAGQDSALPCTTCDSSASCGSCDDPQDACTSCSDPARDAQVDAAPATGCNAATPECEANKVETQEQACGACNSGKQTISRTCSPDTCTWSTWTVSVACHSETAACHPGDVTACANGDDCGQRVCGDSCKWSDCQPKQPGGCLRIGPGHTDQGSNFRCCGGTGHWQFCLPSCTWSSSCVACSEGAPDYCSQCY